MTRIIAGTAGSRRMRTPPGIATRPTSERVREAVFARLDHDPGLAGSTVLDLYAGSGALGLEAASRGAEAVTLVESDRAVARLAADNARRLGLEAVSVMAEPVSRWLERSCGHRPFDIVFADPPYRLAETELADVLAVLHGDRYLARTGVLVVERSRRAPEPRWPSGMARIGQRGYGDTQIWYAGCADPTMD